MDSEMSKESRLKLARVIEAGVAIQQYKNLLTHDEVYSSIDVFRMQEKLVAVVGDMLDLTGLAQVIDFRSRPHRRKRCSGSTLENARIAAVALQAAITEWKRVAAGETLTENSPVLNQATELMNILVDWFYPKARQATPDRRETVVESQSAYEIMLSLPDEKQWTRDHARQAARALLAGIELEIAAERAGIAFDLANERAISSATIMLREWFLGISMPLNETIDKPEKPTIEREIAELKDSIAALALNKVPANIDGLREDHDQLRAMVDKLVADGQSDDKQLYNRINWIDNTLSLIVGNQTDASRGRRDSLIGLGDRLDKLGEKVEGIENACRSLDPTRLNGMQKAINALAGDLSDLTKATEPFRNTDLVGRLAIVEDLLAHAIPAMPIAIERLHERIGKLSKVVDDTVQTQADMLERIERLEPSEKPEYASEVTHPEGVTVSSAISAAIKSMNARNAEVAAMFANDVTLAPIWSKERSRSEAVEIDYWKFHQTPADQIESLENEVSRLKAELEPYRKLVDPKIVDTMSSDDVKRTIDPTDRWNLQGAELDAQREAKVHEMKDIENATCVDGDWLCI